MSRSSRPPTPPSTARPWRRTTRRDPARRRSPRCAHQSRCADRPTPPTPRTTPQGAGQGALPQSRNDAVDDITVIIAAGYDNLGLPNPLRARHHASNHGARPQAIHVATKRVLTLHTLPTMAARLRARCADLSKPKPKSWSTQGFENRHLPKELVQLVSGDQAGEAAADNNRALRSRRGRQGGRLARGVVDRARSCCPRHATDLRRDRLRMRRPARCHPVVAQ